MLYGSPAGATPLPGIRTILVPPDIVAVTRRSPPVRKKPPCRRRPEGEPIERAGGRHWFDDRLFVEPRHEHMRGSLGGSFGVHALVVSVAIVLAAQFELPPVPKVHARLVFPAMLLMPSMGSALAPASGPVRPSAGGSRPAQGEVSAAVAPVDAPSSLEPETGDEGTPGGGEDGSEGGVDGIEGPGVGGFGEGTAGTAGSSGTASSGPLRLGNFAPPRKIKDVRPTYPQLARALQARGTVIIDITIGTDGKVRDTRIVHSVPELDQAALDAVRQWEYEPTRVNGSLVALIITVVVNFAVQ
jgi:protein TonB